MTAAARRLAAATALACALVAVGCGLGAGPSSSGTATLTVTRDYGSRVLVEATADHPPSSETVMRFLDREAEITTRYGGGFVQSIDGVSGGHSEDWFFYVNGIESPIGAAEVRVKGGDRIWWDYRDWSGAMRVPAVVGSWPEPFAQASAEDPEPVRVVCLGVHPACSAAADRLAEAGVTAKVASRAQEGSDSGTPRLLVGPWTRVQGDPAMSGLRLGTASTGVFATFKGSFDTEWRLIGADQALDPTRNFGSGAGLVAALGRDGDPPTWIVTGSGASAVHRAAGALDSRSLRNRYAVAATAHGTVPLPIVRG
jgi:Domain of unknown function (DUF4430)